MTNKIQSFDYLFNSFSRFVGSPHQTRINSFQELQHFMSINNGINPCFTTINSFQNGNTIARTIFNDFDAEFILTCKICGQKLKESDTVHCTCGNSTQFDKEPEELRRKKIVIKIKQAQHLAQTYEDYHLPWVPHFTAKKGVHIFPLFHPEKFQDSDLITNLFYYFIDQAKCYDNQEVKTCKLCDRTVDGDICACGSKSFKVQTFKIPHPDTVVVSDLKRLCRLPGCKRSNGLYCIAVPPEDFLSMKPMDLFEMAKTPTQSVLVKEPTMKMSEFKFKRVDIDKFHTNKTSHDYAMDSTILSLPDDLKRFIVDMFPQGCLRTKLPTLEPRDEIRYGAVVHMKKIGMSKSDVISFFSKLGWRDFSYDKTNPRVNSIFNNSRCRFSHKKMRMLGLCDKKECRFK